MQSYDVLSYTTCNILCYFWYMCRYNVIWPSQCVNVCLLNCLNLFLKYKIGWACFVCVCVCVCVCFGIKMLNIFFFVERWFWEFKMLFGSLVELHVWLQSCLCFSLLWKTFFKQSRQLLNTSRHLAYLSSSSVAFNRNLDTSQ